MLIFLDIDGVLHPGSGPPVDAHRRFTRLSVLVEAVSGFEDIEIVISSQWRHHLSLDELKALLGSDLGGKTLDVTLVGARSAEVRKLSREQEILDWLHYHGRETDQWIAIDDAADEFIRNAGRLVACDPSVGFSEQDAKVLRALLLETHKRKDDGHCPEA